MTNYASIQFFPVTELRERAQNVGDNVKTIKIYTGDGGSRGALAYQIKRDGSGRFPEAAFNYFESRYNGIYTAVFMPGGETMYLESAEQNNSPWQQQSINYDYLNGANTPGQQYKNFNAGQFIARILELERKNAELEKEVEQLEDELEQFETGSSRLQHSMVGVLNNWILPWMSTNGPAQLNGQKPMQGIPQYNTNQNMSWTQKPIDAGDPQQTVNNAVDVLFDAFGPENLVKMAKKLQSNPNLVQMLTSQL